MTPGWVQHVAWVTRAPVTSTGVETLCVLADARHQALVDVWDPRGRTHRRQDHSTLLTLRFTDKEMIVLNSLQSN